MTFEQDGSVSSIYLSESKVVDITDDGDDDHHEVHYWCSATINKVGVPIHTKYVFQSYLF